MAGAIHNIINYYIDSHKYEKEIERAEKEFFTQEDGSFIISMDNLVIGLFNEWLLFDFKLSSGKGLLEDYYYLNPRKRPLYEMQVCRDLQENVYGPLLVLHVDEGRGMKVKVAHKDKIYYVEEYSATLDLEKGDLFFGRVGRVGDHYELTGSNPLNISKMFDKKSSNSLFKGIDHFSPKDALRIFNRNEQQAPVQRNKKTLTVPELKKQINNLLEKAGVSRFLNADLIQRWLLNISFNNPGSAAYMVNDFVGTNLSLKDEDKLQAFMQDLINSSPQKILKGQVPAELAGDIEFGANGFNINSIGGPKMQSLNKAVDYLREDEIHKAFLEYQKALKYLLKEKITVHRIYRVYGNLAVCYMHIGEENLARKCLEVALEVNSDYAFAKRFVKRLDGYENASITVRAIKWNLKHGHSKKIKEFKKEIKDFSDIEICKAYYELKKEESEMEWNLSLEKKYFNFLKKLELDFRSQE